MNDKIAEKDFLRDEYNNLRQEVGNRVNAKFTLLQIALGAFGTIVGFGFQTNNLSLMLLYPPLGFILFSIYVSNSFDTERIGEYIQLHIEPQVEWKILADGQENVGWQTFISIHKNQKTGLAGYISMRSVFLFTELFAIIAAIFTKPEVTFLASWLGILKPTPDVRVNVLLLFAILCFFLSLLVTIFVSALGAKLRNFFRRLTHK